MDFNNVFEEFPTIETKNIILRRLKDEDAEDLYVYYSNINVYQYLDWFGPKDIENSHEVIKFWNDGYENGWIIRFAIENKKTKKLIGTIFLSDFQGKRADVGYELSEDYWQKNIMSEALKEVLDLGFNKLNLERIQAFVRDENIASKNLLKKFDFKEEGLLKKYETNIVTGKCNDMYVYGLIKE